jgi:hypothetical protein
MSINCITCFSISIILFSSNLLADTFLSPAPYKNCFQAPYYQHDNPPHEEALAIGECFYLAAEDVLLDDDNDQYETSSSRTHIILALQYADSWFRLAIQKGNSIAITHLHHTELNLTEVQQKQTPLSSTSSSNF